MHKPSIQWRIIKMSSSTANRFSALSMDDDAPLSLPKTKVQMTGIPKRVPMAYIPPHLRSQQQQQQVKSKDEFPSLALQRSAPSPVKPTLSFADKVKTELPKQSLPRVSPIEPKYSAVSTPSPYWKSKQESFSRYSPEHEYEEHNSGEDLDHDVYGQTYSYSKSNSKYNYDEASSGESDQEDDEDY